MVTPVRRLRNACLAFSAAAVLALALPCVAQSPAPAPVDETAQLLKQREGFVAAGNYAAAATIGERILAALEQAHGPDHPDLVPALNRLTDIYAKLGRFADGERAARRSLAIQEKTRGPEHPGVAVSLSNLAMVYTEEGRYREAEPLFRRALAILEKMLHADDQRIGTIRGNLAALYAAEGRYADAAALFAQSLAIQEKAHPGDDPAIAMAANNLAWIYKTQGRYADAEPLLKRSLAIMEKNFGLEHPLVATALNNLASNYDSAGQRADAELLYRRSLAIREKMLPPDHPDIAISLNNLAALYAAQSRYADAAPLLERALAMRERALGPGHPAVALALANLAECYRAQGRYQEARPLFERAIAIRERAQEDDHPDLAIVLNNLALLEVEEGRYAEAESLDRRALAIQEKALGPDHPSVATMLGNLIDLYRRAQRVADAVPLLRRTVAGGSAAAAVALPALYDARAARAMSAEEAFAASLDVAQRASQTSTAGALNALSVRLAAGTGRLADLVRKDQDLAAEAGRLDHALIAAVSTDPAKRNAGDEQRIRERIAAIARERAGFDAVLVADFPDYVALSKPRPLAVREIKRLLADDEALVVIALGAKSYAWVVTASATEWKELPATAAEVRKLVASLRAMLDFGSDQPFDPSVAFELYRKVLAPVEEAIAAKARLSFVLDGALTSLPPQLLVARDPWGTALADVDWLVRKHAITVLPSVASLRTLRGRIATPEAGRSLIGFADPVFAETAQPSARMTADVAIALGGTQAPANAAALSRALPPLPDTADELKRVAAALNARDVEIFFGPAATKTRVVQSQLDQYRIVYFATHGLVAGEASEFARRNTEPALVLSLPAAPNDGDDGLLTATEIAQLKLNADWVVLSACNTAAGDKPGAQALSGLARAFFYAGGRSLLVSHWQVETHSAVALMSGIFAALAARPGLSHGEALREAILAVMRDKANPSWANPKFWAPFVVVGEPAKP
jgi:CHAT domain-containing protein/Flp pilus assembly protein TadD